MFKPCPLLFGRGKYMIQASRYDSFFACDKIIGERPPLRKFSLYTGNDSGCCLN